MGAMRSMIEALMEFQTSRVVQKSRQWDGTIGRLHFEVLRDFLVNFDSAHIGEKVKQRKLREETKKCR